ncbi:WXG100 family type VII secretion target [Kitasatospora sp. NBC_00374]|uniref:WXG100 family type VII secretion target n=1 Tax=Kitasatospora sp. NBC_00374 TaxID=2975964 RepID=UPI0030E38AEC
MTTPTSVTVEGMLAAQNSFREAHSSARSQLAAMTEQVSMLGSNWTGDAAGTFNGAMQTWLQDFNGVVSALDGMTHTLEQNTGVYRSTTANADQIASGVASSMHTPLAGL